MMTPCTISNVLLCLLRFFRPSETPDIDLAVLRELCVGRCALLEDRTLLCVIRLFVRAAVAEAAALDVRDRGRLCERRQVGHRDIPAASVRR